MSYLDWLFGDKKTASVILVGLLAGIVMKHAMNLARSRPVRVAVVIADLLFIPANFLLASYVAEKLTPSHWSMSLMCMGLAVAGDRTWRSMLRRWQRSQFARALGLEGEEP